VVGDATDFTISLTIRRRLTGITDVVVIAQSGLAKLWEVGSVTKIAEEFFESRRNMRRSKSIL
jgi:hypothetical protein